MNLFFWTLLNLGVPIIGPIFTLGLVVPARGWRAARAMIAASVKDGQLFWCATGLCASAMYEGLTALERGSDKVSMLEVNMLCSCLLGFSCSVVVMTCLLGEHDERMESDDRHGQPTAVNTGFTRVVTGLSIFMVALSAFSFAFLHVYLI